ncbi:class III lanthionine synthetase LanKC [Krasilnikovia sp. MM14-A1004]|uniref:class III lanthionine synthetase LanKC n=1 Tax=Krasilnikovia sp. MM14-A1004 TaxID=3373541 RepID=UPI00399CF008
MQDAIPQLLDYCQADPDFFETPARMRDTDSRFATADRALPDGWHAREQDLWVVLEPPGAELPEQGWKVHVSATPDTAGAVCDTVVDYCLRHGIAVKFLRSRAAVQLLNSKHVARGASGKLLALYPRDEEQLARTLPDLAGMLRGHTGPYILSDLRYEDSPVYVRYGAFQAMTCPGPNGEPVYAIREPGGRLVPDDRSPRFTIPSWVTPPPVLHESLARRAAGGAEQFPYRIERPLHFSNGGGIYLATPQDGDGHVVLREARPYAGLDGNGLDAVARLAVERTMLARLDGLDCVPRLLGHFVVWEHEFLVEEYIEGQTLMAEVFDRYPLVGPDATPEARSAYVRWATDMLARVDHALSAVHARGVRFGDLHPANIMVRPDGRVVLVDFEIAGDLDDTGQPGLAAPGFEAPAGLTGRAADAYVLDCLRQWMFLPISPLTERDPVKLASLTEDITEEFAVPKAFGARLVRRFTAAHGPLGDDGPARLLGAEEPDWPRIRDSIVRGILASATPERTDRLFPGDPQQFATGGFPVAYGAAGVLWALHQAGAEVPAELMDWLAAAAARATDPRPGLLDGLHGAAVVLDVLGRPDAAREVCDRARKLDLATPGVHGGLAGAGFSLLHFADSCGDEALLSEAVDVGHRLGDMLTGEVPFRRVGLQHGLTGVALYLLDLHRRTGDPRMLELAAEALRREVAQGRFLPDGTFQLLEANRYLTYLGTGSSGLALVLARYLAHADADRAARDGFPAAIDGVRTACRAVFVRHPFLFEGRAGTIAALRLLAVPEDRPLIRAHVRRLGWHALSHRGQLAFPGNQLLRLSMDLATGGAGILAALGVAFGPNAAIIPALDLRSPAFEADERR